MGPTMLNVRARIDHLPLPRISATPGSLLLVTALLFSIPMEAQKSGLLVDLTTPQSQGQDGLGVPGLGISAIEGQPVDEHKYEMPLRIEIVRSSVDKSGDFILQVKIQNIGQAAVELPVSRKASDVERKSGSFRRELFFTVRPMATESRPPNVVGATVGSHAVPPSLVRLEPLQSFRVLLRVESRWVKSSLPRDGKEIRVEVTCGEWALKDDSFFIESTAQNVISGNTAVLGFNDNLSTAAVSEP